MHTRTTDTKDKKAKRFARKSKKANRRNRDCRLDAENNPRDERKQEHKDAVRQRSCLLARILSRDIVDDIQPEPQPRLIKSTPGFTFTPDEPIVDIREIMNADQGVTVRDRQNTRVYAGV
jgi:hypothetical protein